MVELALYNSSLFPPKGPRRLAMTMHQRLFERGLRPPWVWSRDRCTSYWANQVAGSANAPETYSGKSRAIVELLDRFWRPEVNENASVLETGCNAGANLYGLFERGYHQLSAVEINSAAVAEMRRAFPELATTPITLGKLEDALPDIPSNSVDVVFSMAVLLHVHPASKQVFAEMVRIARGHLCVIEAESSTAAYVFARNYRRVFERLGCAQLRSVRLTEDAFPEVGAGYWGYTARLFAVPPESPRVT